MKTTGILIPEVRAALRRGDCAGARILIGDAQRGRLTARQQASVRRLLQTVDRCDIQQGVGRPSGSRRRRARGLAAPAKRQYETADGRRFETHQRAVMHILKMQGDRKGWTDYIFVGGSPRYRVFDNGAVEDM